MISKPEFEYFCHSTTSSRLSKDIATPIIETLSERKIDLLQLRAIGLDGTTVNTGHT